MTESYYDKNICLLIIQRSFGAQTIFQNPLDYKFYLKLMKRYKETYCIKIFAFCLLESSLYIVAGAADVKAVADFLGQVNQSFCAFVSVRDHCRSALCIQRSKVLVIDDDRSLYDLVSFVEAFPLKRGMVDKEQDYEWCSFRLRVFGIETGLVEDFKLLP